MQLRQISLRHSTLLHAVLQYAVCSQIHAASLPHPCYPAAQSTLFCTSNYTVFRRQGVRTIDRHFSSCVNARKKEESFLPHTCSHSRHRHSHSKLVYKSSL